MRPREQVEAAIGDEIATMSVEEVLTDKQPDHRGADRPPQYRRREGRGAQNDDEGLGIKIVTVQLKEALVSLQRPGTIFRRRFSG